MAFSPAEQARIARAFFRKEEQNIETASQETLRVAAQSLRRRTIAEIKRQFKAGPRSNAGFFKAVKVHNLKPDLNRGPASYVRLGVPFMAAFQEGASVSGNENLIVLLPGGQALGFRRITPGNRWATVWQTIRKVAKIVPTVDGGQLIVVRQGGQVPILDRPEGRPQRLLF